MWEINLEKTLPCVISQDGQILGWIMTYYNRMRFAQNHKNKGDAAATRLLFIILLKKETCKAKVMEHFKNKTKPSDITTCSLISVDLYELDFHQSHNIVFFI